MGIESGDDPTTAGPEARGPGISSPVQPPRSPFDPYGPPGAPAPMPTGLVGGPSPAAWGWPPAMAWSYWPGAPVLPPRPRLPIVATILAVGAGITFSLPWATFSYSLSSAYDLGSFSYSVSLISMLDDGGWIAHLWPNLVVFGFLLAIASSLLDAVFRLGRQAAIAEALGFGSISAGVVVALASRFGDWPGSLDTFNSVSPALGAWLCLLLAAAGAAVALVRFVSPRAFTPATVAPVAPPAAGPFPPGYPTQYAPQYPVSYPPPYGAPYPTSYAPQYPPIWASQSPLLYDSRSEAEGAAGEAIAQAPSLDLPGAPGTLVVVEAGRAATRSVSPGERLIVGRDPASSILLADPMVSPHHASIERRGPGWLVRGLDIANPTWLLDATGRPHPIQGELGLRSGELLIGGAHVLLYPPGEARPG